MQKAKGGINNQSLILILSARNGEKDVVNGLLGIY